MSASIKGSVISLTRGDSLILNLSISRNCEEYIPSKNDVVRFALKKSITDSTPLILKEANLSNMTIRLEPSDTKNLNTGTYIYDVELTTSEGYVDTFIGPSKFIITDEVY